MLPSPLRSLDGSTWLIKSEPYKFSFDQLVKDERAVWDGVRNFEARNNLRAMKRGDLLLFYHSNEGKEIVGLASVEREAYEDPTDTAWAAVDIVPVARLKVPVSLALIKATPELASIALVRKSRVSVVPITTAERDLILTLAKTALPKRKKPLLSSRHHWSAVGAAHFSRTSATATSARLGNSVPRRGSVILPGWAGTRASWAASAGSPSR